MASVTYDKASRICPGADRPAVDALDLVYRSKTPVQVCDLRFGDQISLTLSIGPFRCAGRGGGGRLGSCRGHGGCL
jgi:hypothetical protein